MESHELLDLFLIAHHQTFPHLWGHNWRSFVVLEGGTPQVLQGV